MSDNQSQLVKDFIAKVVRVCNEFGMSISHQDSQGAFVIELYNQHNIKWLEAANDETGENRRHSVNVVDRIKPISEV